jgi:type II secretory pathway component PulJ
MNNQIVKMKQTGASLMEVLVAMSISLVVTAAMVALMANSLGTTARIVKMTKLSDDMRVAMQMMTRDVRRSSYNANAMLCYANDNCGSDGAITVAGDLTISDSNNCLTFLLDRDHDGDSTEDSAGGFRHVTVGDVGVIEMWTGDSAPDCGSEAGSTGWVQITNPDNMDIFGFTVDDDLSYTQVIQDDGFGNTLSQKVRKVRMNIRGRLVIDNTIVRRVEDVINVRNDLLL